jgi:hypothetical protein
MGGAQLAGSALLAKGKAFFGVKTSLTCNNTEHFALLGPSASAPPGQDHGDDVERAAGDYALVRDLLFCGMNVMEIILHGMQGHQFEEVATTAAAPSQRKAGNGRSVGFSLPATWGKFLSFSFSLTPPSLLTLGRCARRV